jgi:copper resistance protein D
VTGPVLALNILFAVLSDAAYALIVGSLLAIQWLNTTGAASAIIALLRRICLACAAVLILGQVVRPWFAAASMSGSSAFASNLALIPDILSATHVGKVWYLGSVALVGLLATLLLAGAQVRPIAVSLFLIGCAKAASGHAAGAGDFTLAELSMFLHIAATAVWAGTVIVSGLIVLTRLAKLPATEPWSYAKRLSATVTWALAIILLSGVFISYTELSGQLSGLWTSGWGRVLLTKLAFVSLALALGAATRFKCVRRPATGERAALMARLMRAEASVMIVILCLSGLLANTAPAMTEARLYSKGMATPRASHKFLQLSAALNQ